MGKGEILGFLGPNGAGKTTTMRILSCYFGPTAGTARVARSNRAGPLWRLLDRWDRYLPMVETREFQSPWRAESDGPIDLYAYPGGYLLIHPEQDSDK